jgi:hypothetical protein
MSFSETKWKGLVKMSKGKKKSDYLSRPKVGGPRRGLSTKEKSLGKVTILKPEDYIIIDLNEMAVTLERNNETIKESGGDGVEIVRPPEYLIETEGGEEQVKITDPVKETLSKYIKYISFIIVFVFSVLLSAQLIAIGFGFYLKVRIFIGDHCSQYITLCTSFLLQNLDLLDDIVNNTNAQINSLFETVRTTLLVLLFAFLAYLGWKRR